MKYRDLLANVSALLLLSATASALPASRAGARPKPATVAKLGRRASVAKGNQAATRPTPTVSKAAKLAA
ncbi:MAG: hypothetical protein WBV96_14335, partial [Polyangia bacterium]